MPGQTRPRARARSRAHTLERTTEESTMSTNYGRLTRAILLAGGITAAVALPAITGTPLLPSQRDASSHIALAAPAANNDNNDDRTNDNSEERNIEGQVLDLKENQDPPQALVGMVGGNVW